MKLNPIPEHPAEIAKELGRFLSDVQAQAKVSGAVMSRHAGHEQSWWSKLINGKTRGVDVDALKAVALALKLPARTSDYMIELAEALNTTKGFSRVVFSRQGSAVFHEYEERLFSESFLRISSPDRIPIQLWCHEFAEALTANLCPRDRDALLATAERWRRRLDAERVRFSWVVGEAALRRTYGLNRAALAAQLDHMEQFTTSARWSSELGVVPFDANLRVPMRELRVAQNQAAVDLFTGVVQFREPGEFEELLAEFEALPAKRGYNALALLHDARKVHLVAPCWGGSLLERQSTTPDRNGPLRLE